LKIQSAGTQEVGPAKYLQMTADGIKFYVMSKMLWFYRFLWFLYYKPVKTAFLQQCYNKRCLIFANIAQFCCAIQFFNRLQNILVAASMRGLRLTT